MLDSDQLKGIADVNVNAPISVDFLQVTTQFVHSWTTFTSAIIRLEKPIAFGFYCAGISIVFWSGSIFMESARKFYNREKP